MNKAVDTQREARGQAQRWVVEIILQEIQAGSGRRSLGPAFPLLFHGDPVSHTFLHRFPEFHFLFQRKD